jgi:thiamine transport system substrate-binding protein
LKRPKAAERQIANPLNLIRLIPAEGLEASGEFPHTCPLHPEQQEVPMRSYYLTTLSLLALMTTQANAAENLTIYTYESFTAEWGPGPKVEAAFEKECACDLKFVPVADGVAILNRLKLEGDKTEADIVLGLDTNLTQEATATSLFAPHGIDTSIIKVPSDYKDDVFVPYDFAHFAVIYDSEKVKNPPKSMADLIAGAPDQKIVIEDPRTSTPGLGLVLWMKQLYGEKAGEAWTKLKPRILTVTPGWSEAYGLFTKGEAEMVLSYTTSPAYHQIAENSSRYVAAAFEEGHYLQIEVAGQTKKGAANPLSAKFLSFMISPAFQDTISENNWMFPAAKTSAPLNPVFDTLVKPAKTLLYSAKDVADNRKVWIDEWQQAMGK